MFYSRQKRNDMVWAGKKVPDDWTIVWCLILDSIITFAAAVLFLFCMKKCMRLLFPLQKFPKHFIMYSVYAMLPLFTAVTLEKIFFRPYQKWVHGGICACYMAVICLVLWKNWESLLAYSTNLLENYLSLINSYSKLHLTVGGDLCVLDDRPGILFWGITFYLFYLVWGVLFEKKYLLSMPVFCFVLLLMVVGKTPDYTVFAYGFSGMAMIFFRSLYRLDGVRGEFLGAGRWKSSFYVLFVTGVLFIFLVAGLPYFSKHFFKKQAKGLMVYAPLAKEFQLELENTLEAAFLSGFEKGEGAVDNKAPHYSGTEVMEVTVNDEAPKSTQYFRGFYGTDYENGIWVNDGSFTESCKKAGYSPEVMSDFLAFPASSYYQQRKEGIEAFPDTKLEKREMTLVYKGFRGGYVYIPYMLGELWGGGGQKFRQDAFLEKDTFQKKYHFITWDPAFFEDMTLSSSAYYSEIEALYSARDEEERAWKEWYDGYVEEHYLKPAIADVPEIQKVAQKGIRFFREKPKSEKESERTEEALSSKERFGIFRMTHYLQSFFKKFTYSLELDEIAPGMDPLEYFLKTSHKGYCVHFASAGVLILRKMGVPARYATGYAVKPGRWKKNKNGSYTAKVMDSDAHAWAEVYFWGLGWIPIEMTPGDSEEVQVAENDGENREKEEKEALKKEENMKEEKNATSEVLETPKASAVPEPTLQAAGSDKEKKTDGGKNGDVRKDGNTGMVRLLLLLILFFVPVLIFITRFFYIKYFRNKTRQVWHLFRRVPKGRNREAVCRMNHKIYHRLCRKCHLFKRKITDAEYGHLLKKTYPGEDWEEFMRIVKKANFSENEITEEETEICRRLYKM